MTLASGTDVVLAPAREGELGEVWPEVRGKVAHVMQKFQRLRQSKRRYERALSRASSLSRTSTLEDSQERFQRSAQTATCLYLLEEGRSTAFAEAADIPLKFKQASPKRDQRPDFDLVLTSMPSAVMREEPDDRIEWVNSLPAVSRDDLHYAPFEVQKLMESRGYLRAISEACRQMLGLKQPEDSLGDHPAIVRPRRHEDLQRFITFGARGLEAARAKAGKDCIVDRFVEEGAKLYHMHVIDLNVFVLERPCLPHVSCSMSRKELEAVAEELGGEYSADDAYIRYDSGVFLQRRMAQEAERCPQRAMPLAEVEELKGLAPKIEQLASILEEALSISMFGFDVLLDRGCTETFHLVGLGLVPSQAFDGAEDLSAVTALHLFEECQQRAVRADIREVVENPRQVLDLLAAQHPDWNDLDMATIKVRVLSASTHGDKTGLVASVTGPGRDPIICRLRGVVQRTMFEQAIANEMLDIPNMPLVGSYFGSRVLIGYTEAMVKGAQLEKVVGDINRKRMCRSIGAALSAVHRREVDVQSPDFLGVPLCVSRMRANAIIAWEAINHVESLRPQFDEVFKAVLAYDIRSLPEEARAEVFGHFDLNLTNVLVDVSAPPEEAPKVSIIDWEQAGPNIAAYDFGKFLVSLVIALDVDAAELKAMATDLCEGYAPEWSGDAKGGLIQGMLAMMPYVAALNFMSNVRHAATEDGDRWKNRGRQHFGIWQRYRKAWCAPQGPHADMNQPMPMAMKSSIGSGYLSDQRRESKLKAASRLSGYVPQAPLPVA